MTSLLLPFALIMILSLATDWYIFCAIKARCRYPKVAIAYAVISALCLLAVAVCAFLPRATIQLQGVMWAMFAYLTIYFPKMLFVVIDLIASIPKLWHGHRISAVSIFGGVLAMLLCIVMWWGALVNRYQIDVKEIDVEIPRLPAPFKGYTIAQISDLHVGTYGSDTTYLSRLVDYINGLNPDAIVFTGDIVNTRSDELLPFTGVLSRLDAPDGVYSVLGNHDYGDYNKWPSEEAKERNLQMLIDMQRAMGWRLLNDEHEMIYRDGESIALIGVQNVSEPPFKSRGDLRKAYQTLDDNKVKVLLSHNPRHWTDSIADNPATMIDLTLSGHTHAMQIEVFGLSPAAWRYKTWGGMYDDRSHLRRLYVNVGIGTIGLPMRIGATPEVTLFKLK